MKSCLTLTMIALVLASCDEMTHQPKYGAYAKSALFADGKAMQAPPDGAVARDDPAADADLTPPAMTLALLQRGEARYNIYCSPCHDAAGSGQGTVPDRGFPHPPSFHTDRLRQVSASYMVSVIRNGHGVMYPFADRITPADRWAIVGYIRALQFSQHAAFAALPAALQTKLNGADDAP